MPTPTLASVSISDENIHQITEQMRLGNGSVYDVDFSPKGDMIAAAGSLGVWLYDADDLTSLALLEGHTQSVISVEWSPDGNWIASGGKDKTLRIWNLDGQEVMVLKAHGGHRGQVNDIAWSPNSKNLASASSDGDVRVWDLGTGEISLHLENLANDVFCVAWSPDGETLAVGAISETILLFDVASGEALPPLEGHEEWVHDLDWSPDGEYLAAAEHDSVIRIWDLSTGQSQAIDTNTDFWAYGQTIAWSPDGSHLATGFRDNSIRIVSSDGVLESVFFIPFIEESASFKFDIPYGVNGLAWSPDGSRIVTAGGLDTLRLWNVNTDQQVERLSGYNKAIWSPDGSLLAASSTTDIYILDSQTNEIVQTLDVDEGMYVDLHAWSPDGNYLAAGGLGSSEVLVWDPLSGERAFNLGTQGEKIDALAWSQDGDVLAVGDGDGIVYLWDISTGETIKILSDVPIFAVSDLSWSPDGLTLLIAGHSNTFWIWDHDKDELLEAPIEFPKFGFTIHSIAWDPNQEYLALGCGDMILVLDASSWQEISVLQKLPEPIYSLEWSPDGRYLLFVSDGVRVWDPNSQKNIFIYDQVLRGVSWSPDGGHFSAGSTIFGANSIIPVAVAEDHTVAIRSLALAPDGRLAATGHDDGRIRVWEISTGELISDLRGLSDHILSLAWSPDGSKLASGSHDNTARVWDVKSGTSMLLIEGERPVSALDWTQDGEFLAIGVGNELQIWNVVDDRIDKVKEGDGESKIYDLDWIHGGERLAVAYEDGSINIWSSAPMRLQEVLKGHENYVYAVDWSSDGKRLSSAGFDGSFRIWLVKDIPPAAQLIVCEDILNTLYDIAWSPTGEYLATVNRHSLLELCHPDSCESIVTLPGHMDAVSGVAWSPDQSQLITSSWDGTLHIWHLDDTSE